MFIKNSFIKKLILLTNLVLISILLIGCSPEEQFQNNLDQVLSEKITYNTYNNNGISVKYPYFPETENKDDNVEVSVSRGYCSIVLNTEQMPAKNWYTAIINSITQNNNNNNNQLNNNPNNINNNNISILKKDPEDLFIKYSATYEGHGLITETKIVDCNNYSTAVLVMCIKEAYDKSQQIHRTVFDSITCDGQKPIINDDDNNVKTDNNPETNDNNKNLNYTMETNSQNNNQSAAIDIQYLEFSDFDFITRYPNWNNIENNSNETILGKTIGICSVFVNKYNARPDDLAKYINISINEKKDHDILNYKTKNNEIYLDYSFPYEEYILTTKTKTTYCNYVSYITSVACINSMLTPELSEMQDLVIGSSSCKVEYIIPTSKKIEEKKKALVKTDPKIIEEIQKDIVKTDIGKEFGIDEEVIVYFINNNVFFTKITRDYPTSNIIFDDKDNNRQLKLKITINNKGKITSVEDGQFANPKVSLIVPLRDALNILNNADKINPLTILSFAVNVKTEPPEIKNQVIQNVIQGKYN